VDADLAALLAAGEAAVFHGRPDDAIGPLRSARDMAGAAGQPAEAATATWLLGVALGATGRYGAALDVLLPLVAAAAAEGAQQSEPAALAAATVASVHRQLGRHGVAAGFDRRGLALTTGAGLAAFDCRLGLAADAVGRGDATTAAAELARASALIPAPESGWWRPRVRLDWVRAEVALLVDRAPDAVAASAAAVARAGQASAPRHLAKSLLFLGVSQGQMGNPAAVATLTRAARLAADIGAWPLVWPAEAVLATQLAGADPARSRSHRAAARAVVTQIAAGLPTLLRAEWLTAPDIAALHLD
jgi:hypothetical protein